MTAPAPPSPRAARRAAALRWAIVVAVALLGIALIYIAMTAFVPRWWAEAVGRQVQGLLGRGIAAGLCYGIVFTLVPLIAIAQVRRATWPVQRRIMIGVVGVLLTAPNLITMGITLGRTSAAQAADQLLQTQAPGFQPATAAGALIGGVGGVGVVIAAVVYARQRQQIRTLQVRVAALERPPRS